MRSTEYFSPSLDEDEGLTRASRLAIARAKRRGDAQVTEDDLLVGLLQTISRFGIVVIGPLTIDLEALELDALDELGADGPKVAYSDEASALFDRAAEIARRDRSAQIEPVHMLVAFANREDGLMGRLKQLYGITAAEWRSALARTAPRPPAHRDGKPLTVRDLMSPDEAAEFLGVHTQTVRGYIRSGKLSAHRLAGERAVRIRRQDLIDLLEPYEAEGS